jgi:sugar phosphate isomerase/epimerase
MRQENGLSRRGFIGAAGGAAALGALGPLTTVGGADDDRDDDRRDDFGFGRGDLPLDKIGMQLFTVRDLLADNELDLPGTFEMLRDAGYAEVEIGGTYDSNNNVGRTAAQFRELAEQHDLKPEGMHNPGGHNAWRANTAAVLDDAETLGLRYVGVASPAGGTPQTHDAYRAMAEEFNTFGEAARARGLKFYFHNHPGDFALDGGTPIYDTLLAESDPRLVYFEMDIAWFVAGGQDPYAYLREHGSRRFPLFHVKDLTFTAPSPPPPNVTPDTRNPRTTPGNVALPNRPHWLTDVGKGDIDFARIFSALRDLDDHHYFVEHDDAPEDETNDVQGQPLVRRPRNPAGSANTSWVSRKYLANLDVRRGGGGGDD